MTFIGILYDDPIAIAYDHCTEAIPFNGASEGFSNAFRYCIDPSLIVRHVGRSGNRQWVSKNGKIAEPENRQSLYWHHMAAHMGFT